MEDFESRSFIKGYKPGDNITVLNTIYIRPRKVNNDEDLNKYTPDVLYVIYKDLNTGEKKLEAIENPAYTYYIANGLKPVTYNMVHIDKKYVKPITCKYRDLKLSIAKETNNVDWFYDNIKSGNYTNNERLFTIPSIFQADVDIEDYYRYLFGRVYQNNAFKVSKMYFDIEADVESLKGEFPDMGQCPINACTLVDEANNHIYVLLLEDYSNPQIEELKETPNINEELKAFVCSRVSKSKFGSEFGLDKMEYSIVYFDKEIDLIASIFKIINKIKPDFVLAWNIAFDLPYIIERIKKLGYSNPEDIVCHPDFKYKICEYWIDHRADKYENRGDYAHISSYSVFLDQMITCAARRKGQRSIGSMKLDNVGSVFADIGKLDYSSITMQLYKLPRLNYKIFVFYNVMDTIVQLCVENRINDVDYVFNTAISTNTRYSKVHKQTVYITNRARKEYDKMGYILGNNVNKGNEKKEPYAGAFVADPLLVSDKPKLKVNGKAINVLHNLNDFDYTSLYPSCIDQYNISLNTMIGKIIMDKIYANENRFNNENFDRSLWFTEDLVSQDVLNFCNRYLSLPSYEEMYDLLDEYLRTQEDYTITRDTDFETGERNLYHLIDSNKKRLLYRLIDKDEPRYLYTLIEKRPYDNESDNNNK